MLDAPPLDSVISGPYALEVSSPGLERPLRTPAHFARAQGETISVKTRAGDDHPARRVRGVVGDVDGSGFDLTQDDGTTEHLAYADVAQARTVFEWGPQPKRGKSGTSKKASSPKASSPKANSRRANSRRANSPREPVRP
jgi:ribosome maturation factor RimP